MRSQVFASTLRAGIVGCLLLWAAPATGAEFTDLLDAADDFDDFDEETYDPFDFNIEPSFSFEYGQGEINREAPCGSEDDKDENPRVVTDDDRCPDDSDDPDYGHGTTVENREMDYRHTEATLDIDFRAGLYKDLELSLNVPYVLSSTHGMRYAPGVDSENSSVDPTNDDIEDNAKDAFDENDGYSQSGFNQFTTYRYFELDETYDNIERSGFGDPSVALQWAPFNDERDPTKATLLLGMEYTMPLAPIKTAEDNDVGEGKHVLHWRFASSKRFDWIEPYFGADFFLPMAATNSPIREIDSDNEGQVYTNPPMHGEMTIGSEFIPYANEETGERYAIDLRFSMGYVSEGRDYSPMFDHMANSSCRGKTVDDVSPNFDDDGNLTNTDDVACAWITQQPSNAEGDPQYDISAMSDGDRQDVAFRSDGIMTVEDYGTFAGLLGFYLQPSEYFQLNALAELKHRQEHFMTNARTGRDVDDSGSVSLSGSDAERERNPVYNPTYDSTGKRFRIQAFNTWTFMVNAALQF
ncbi:MAG: hypothetical protein ACOCV2_01025 [Persicimonas sp.]